MAPRPTRQGGQHILIVSSHSCHALIRVAKEILEADGNAVFVNDLVESNFNPTSGRHNFVGAVNADRLDLQDEEKHAGVP